MYLLRFGISFSLSSVMYSASCSLAVLFTLLIFLLRVDSLWTAFSRMYLNSIRNDGLFRSLFRITRSARLSVLHPLCHISYSVSVLQCSRLPRIRVPAMDTIALSVISFSLSGIIPVITSLRHSVNTDMSPVSSRSDIC